MSDHIAWIDTETTGTDPKTDVLLEVGVIVTDRNLVEKDRSSWVLHADPAVLDHALDPYVKTMHSASGLLAEAQRSALFRSDVDEDLADLLLPYTERGKLGWGGSGTSHFDSRFLQVHLPMAYRHLTYWTYDVGVLRRYWRDLFGFPVPEHLTEAKPHRAMADIELHLDEARWYRDWMDNHEPPAKPAPALDDRRFDPAMLDVALHLDSIAQSLDRLTTVAENAVGVGGLRVDLGR